METAELDGFLLSVTPYIHTVINVGHVDECRMGELMIISRKG